MAALPGYCGLHGFASPCPVCHTAVPSRLPIEHGWTDPVSKPSPLGWRCPCGAGVAPTEKVCPVCSPAQPRFTHEAAMKVAAEHDLPTKFPL